MRSDLDDNKGRGLDIRDMRFGVDRQTLSGNYTITEPGSFFYFLDPGASDKDVVLPAPKRGLVHAIVHSGAASNLVVKSAAGAPIATLQTTEGAFFVCSGLSWYYLAYTSTFVLDPTEITSPDSSITVTIVGNAVTITVNETNVDHNALANYVANKHVDHTAVSVSAGTGLSGGGDISVSRTLALDLHGLLSVTPELADELGIYDVSLALHKKITASALNAILDHNALLNYSANRHIDHTGVSISAGEGLTGGGAIDASRTISLGFHSLVADTPASGSEFAFWDTVAGEHNKVTLADLKTAFGLAAIATSGTLSDLAGLGTGVSTFLATPSSANLASALTDETGSAGGGVAVFSNAPALTNPTVTTQSARDNSTKAASTAYVDTATREKLSAARTYYVRADGSDSNTGLANTAGGAFLTWQHAIDIVHDTLDLAGHTVTIQAGGASGTFIGSINVAGPFVGSKPSTAITAVGASVILVGDVTTPTNFLLKTTDASSVVAVSDGAVLEIKGFQLQSTGGGALLDAIRFGEIYVTGNMDFSTTTGNQILSRRSAYIALSANYTISGGALAHYSSSNSSNLVALSITVTLTGTPAFTGAFASAGAISNIVAASITFSGGATGSRYGATLNSAINTGGGGANYFPGDSAGSTATGGQYA